MCPEVLRDDQDHDGPAEGNRHVLRQPAAQERAEGQQAEALDPALVEIAPLVNAVQGDGQAAVQPQHGVAAEEVAGAGTVGLLEMVAGNGVADLAQGEKSPLHDPVEQFLDQFLPRDDFDQVLRQQADFIQRGGDLGAKALAETVLGRLALPRPGLPRAAAAADRKSAREGSRRWALRRCRDTSTRRWLGSSRRIGRRPSDKIHCMTSIVEVVRT